MEVNKVEVKITQLEVKDGVIECTHKKSNYVEYRIICDKKNMDYFLRGATKRNIDTWVIESDNNSALRIMNENTDMALKEKLAMCVLIIYPNQSQEKDEEWIIESIIKALENE